MDIENIIDKLESFGLLRKHKQVGNYMQIYCPFHSDGKERKPSCGILLIEEFRGGKHYPAGLTHCFTCHYAKSLPNMVNDLLARNQVSDEVKKWIAENITSEEYDDSESEKLIPDSIATKMSESYAVDYIRMLQKQKIQYVSESELQSYRFTVPYMYERKLTDEIINQFDIGYDANWIPPGRKRKCPCITFPVRDRSGNTLFFCRRSIEGKIYNYPTGVVKPLYGIDMIPKQCRRVFICESIINALTLWTWGFYAVALMGTGNALQMQQLKELGVYEYVICLDGDEAGTRGTEKLKKTLKYTSIVWTIHMIAGKDVNDISKQEFLELLKNME